MHSSVRWLPALLLAWALAAAAQVAVPPLTVRVTDQTGTLTAEQKAGLESALRAFEARKGSQIAVLMVPTVKPEAIEQYSMRVAEQWKIGRKKVDDGAILVIAKDDRELRIEVGYGLEGALNDATARRIVDEVIVPRFREGDFYGGIAAGVDRMIRVIDGEPLPAPKAPPGGGASGGLGQLIPILFIGALVIGGMLRALLGRFLGSVATGGAVGFIAWMIAGALAIAFIAGAIAFFFTLLSGGGRSSAWSPGYRGGWGGSHRGGGFGGGGFGGGGFGGGGGGFGGGGASGRW